MKQVVGITRYVDSDFIEQLEKEGVDVLVPLKEGETLTVDHFEGKEEAVVALWVTLEERINADVFDRFPNLRIVANMAVGFNNIDMEEAKARRIYVVNTPDVLTEATADLAFSLLMATARRLNVAEQSVREGSWTSWEPYGYTGVDIYGQTIGIFGMGRIGEAVARRAKGFGMTILYHNRTRKEHAEEMLGARYVTKEQLLEEADFVVLFSPLTPETENTIDHEALSRMKKHAILINAARGALIDEEALYEALRTEQIFGAGLDVFREEPVSIHHPLLTLPNVVVTPHIGSATKRTRRAMLEMNVQDILAVLRHERPKYEVR